MAPSVIPQTPVAASFAGGRLAVCARGVARHFGNAVALAGIDLEVARGEFFGVIGPDGVGKSSLLKAIAGLIRADGELEVFENDMRLEASAERAKARIGFMPQGLGLNLYPELSIDENLDYLAELRQLPAGVRAESKERLLAMTHLEPFRGRAAGKLSGGMKQKLALCGALIGEPELLVLDEPTTGVDPVSRRDFWDILTDLVIGRRLTAIVATSYLDEAERFERVAFMFGGRIISIGTPDQMRSSVEVRVREFVPHDIKAAMKALDAAGVHFHRNGLRLRVALRPGQQSIVEDSRDRIVPEVPPEDPAAALDDIFAARVAGERGPAPPYLPFPSTAPGRSGGAAPVEVVSLTRRFDSFTAVDAVSFALERGEIFGLLGPNGSGKTTIIKMICGLLRPSAGRARVMGFDVSDANPAIRRHLGYMSQIFSLYRELSVMENLSLYAAMYGVTGADRRGRIEWVLEQAGLRGRERERAGRLPVGERQRLALGCAILHGPGIVFLDEPTSGVDPVARDLFWRIIRDLSAAQRVTILVSTHYLAEAENCDRIALLHAGRLIAVELAAQDSRASRRSARRAAGDKRRAPSRGARDATRRRLRRDALRPRPPRDRARSCRGIRCDRGQSGRRRTAGANPRSHPHPRRRLHRADAGGARCVGGCMTLRRVFAIAGCETRQLRRDPMISVRALGVPLVLFLLFGYGLSLDVEHIPFAVVDCDRSAFSREYIYAFAGNPTFSLRAEAADTRVLSAMLRRGEIRLGMVIPPQFQHTLYKGRPESVQFMVDGVYSYRAEVTRAYALAVSAHVSSEIFRTLMIERTGHAPNLDPLDIETRYLYNESLRATNAIVPGLLPVILMMSPAVMVAVAIVREKELGSIFNFLSSPATRTEFVLGKLIPYAAIGFGDALILGALTVVLFGVPFKGGVLIYCLGAALYVIATAAMGLLFSSFAKSQFGAIVVAMIATMVPSFLYSGLLIPIHNMSLDGRIAAHLFPAMFFNHIVIGAYLKALPLPAMLPDLGAIAIFIVVYLGGGIALTRRREA